MEARERRAQTASRTPARARSNAGVAVRPQRRLSQPRPLEPGFPHRGGAGSLLRFRAGLLRGLAIMRLRVLGAAGSRCRLDCHDAAAARHCRRGDGGGRRAVRAGAFEVRHPVRGPAAFRPFCANRSPGLRVTGSARFVNGLLA